jgi:hypothetical protein
MIYLHLLMATLASWRITELFTQDRITAKLRERWKTYLWQCPRCMSVWSGAFAAAMLALSPVTHGISPWMNYPFALAWLYLTHLDLRAAARMDRDGRRMVIEARGPQWTLSRNDFSSQETQEILSRALSEMIRVQHATQPPQPPQPASAQHVNGGAR